jgi:hypothetical protein
MVSTNLISFDFYFYNNKPFLLFKRSQIFLSEKTFLFIFSPDRFIDQKPTRLQKSNQKEKVSQQLIIFLLKVLNDYCLSTFFFSSLHIK